jgi:hypothetical protein
MHFKHLEHHNHKEEEDESESMTSNHLSQDYFVDVNRQSLDMNKVRRI